MPGDSEELYDERMTLKMMDYCARESTLCEVDETPRVEMPIKEHLESLRKKMSETDVILADLLFLILGSERPEDKYTEPKCMQEELYILENLSDRCMGMTKRLSDLLRG